MMRNAFYMNTPTLLHLPTPLTIPLLYNKNIIVNLFKLHFSSSPFFFQLNKKVFHPLLLHPSNQTHIRENPLFHPPTNFPSFYFFTPPTKQTLNNITLIKIASSQM